MIPRDIEDDLHRHDEALTALGLRVWVGGEPTFTDRFDASPEWRVGALGGDKEERAELFLARMATRMVGGAVLRKGGRPGPMILIGTAIMAVCTLGIFLPGPPVWARLALCLAFSFFGGLIPPSLFSAVPRFAPSPRHVSAGNGMLMQGSALGQFVGAPLVAFAVAQGGGDWSYALGPMLGFALLTALAGWALGRAESRVTL